MESDELGELEADQTVSHTQQDQQESEEDDDVEKKGREMMEKENIAVDDEEDEEEGLEEESLIDEEAEEEDEAARQKERDRVKAEGTASSNSSVDDAHPEGKKKRSKEEKLQSKEARRAGSLTRGPQRPMRKLRNFFYIDDNGTRLRGRPAIAL
jgi:hypothetical protein